MTKAKKEAKKAAGAGKAKAKAKPKAKTVPAAGSVHVLEKEAASLESQIAGVRKNIFGNEKALRAKIEEKLRLDSELNALLRKSFADEKRFLAKVKGSAVKEEADLRERIASLERVNAVFEAKQAKVTEAKKREFALKRQLQELEKQAEVLGPHA